MNCLRPRRTATRSGLEPETPWSGVCPFCRILYYTIVNGLMVMLIFFIPFHYFAVFAKKDRNDRQYQKIDINLTKKILSSDYNAIAIDEMGDFNYDD